MRSGSNPPRRRAASRERVRTPARQVRAALARLEDRIAPDGANAGDTGKHEARDKVRPGDAERKEGSHWSVEGRGTDRERVGDEYC